MNDTRDARIAAAVWPRPGHAEISARGRERARSRKCLLQASVSLAVAVVFFLVLEQAIAGAVVSAIAVAVLLCGRFFPRVYDRVDGIVGATAMLAGTVLTWILLVPFFALVFVPARVVIGLRRKDPLCRRFRAGHGTFWIPRAGQSGGGYDRQY